MSQCYVLCVRLGKGASGRIQTRHLCIIGIAPSTIRLLRITHIWPWAWSTSHVNCGRSLVYDDTPEVLQRRQFVVGSSLEYWEVSWLSYIYHYSFAAQVVLSRCDITLTSLHLYGNKLMVRCVLVPSLAHLYLFIDWHYGGSA